MSRALRWGILSTAKIATGKVIPGILKADRCEIVAIASRDAELARDAAVNFGIPNAHGSYEALLLDPDVDAVYIPLPNHLHAEWTIAAVGAGKHVLCEKPLAMTAADAERMIEAADAAGVHLMEAFMYRHHPSWVAARGLVESGRIGRLSAVQTWFSYFNDDAANIRNIRAFGGGALFDIGCYAVNLSRMLFDGEPTRIAASMQRDAGSGVDVLTSAILDFDAGLASFDVFDADRDRPTSPHLRDRRADLDRDPVQHPAGPSDAHLPHGRRRPAGGAGDGGARVPDRRPVHGRGRDLRDGDPR